MSSKYVIGLRHRPNPNDDIGIRHKRFISRQSEVSKIWAIPDAGVIDLPEITGELVSVIDLNYLTEERLDGQIVYSLRDEKYLRDNAQYDDHVSIEFDPDKINYSDLVLNVFPIFVTAFESYRAAIYERKIARSDFREIIKSCSDSGKDINGRDGVYRINAINYFDRELCWRAFNLSPEQIIDRLEGKVESVSSLHDGVLLIYSSKFLDHDDLEKIDSEIRPLLT